MSPCLMSLVTRDTTTEVKKGENFDTLNNTLKQILDQEEGPVRVGAPKPPPKPWHARFWNWLKSYFDTRVADPDRLVTPVPSYTPPEGYIAKGDALLEALNKAKEEGGLYQVVLDGHGYGKVAKIHNTDNTKVPQSMGVQVIDPERLGSRAVASCPFCGAATMPDVSAPAERPLLVMGSDAAKFFTEQREKIIAEIEDDS